MAEPTIEQLQKEIKNLKQMNFSLHNACDFDENNKPIDKTAIISQRDTEI